jgi:hypothetical protein
MLNNVIFWDGNRKIGHISLIVFKIFLFPQIFKFHLKFSLTHFLPSGVAAADNFLHFQIFPRYCLFFFCLFPQIAPCSDTRIFLMSNDKQLLFKFVRAHKYSRPEKFSIRSYFYLSLSRFKSRVMVNVKI